jgi:hypothetical protein
VLPDHTVKLIDDEIIGYAADRIPTLGVEESTRQRPNALPSPGRRAGPVQQPFRLQ